MTLIYHINFSIKGVESFFSWALYMYIVHGMHWWHYKVWTPCFVSEIVVFPCCEEDQQNKAKCSYFIDVYLYYQKMHDVCTLEDVVQVEHWEPLPGYLYRGSTNTRDHIRRRKEMIWLIAFNILSKRFHQIQIYF